LKLLSEFSVEISQGFGKPLPFFGRGENGGDMTTGKTNSFAENDFFPE
jgi:hypothetical protein